MRRCARDPQAPKASRRSRQARKASWHRGWRRAGPDGAGKSRSLALERAVRANEASSQTLSQRLACARYVRPTTAPVVLRQTYLGAAKTAHFQG